MRVEINVGQASIVAEGELSELQAILSEYWLPVIDSLSAPEQQPSLPPRQTEASSRNPSRKRKPSRARTPDENGAQSSQLDATDLANGIKQRPDFESIKNRILDVSGKWKDKCMLVAVVADAPISSGDVKRVMEVLRIKASLSTLSRTLSDNSADFLTQAGTNNSTLYTVTETAKSKFLNELKSEDE